jgi:hypothetical protein
MITNTVLRLEEEGWVAAGLEVAAAVGVDVSPWAGWEVGEPPAAVGVEPWAGFDVVVGATVADGLRIGLEVGRLGTTVAIGLCVGLEVGRLPAAVGVAAGVRVAVAEF